MGMIRVSDHAEKLIKEHTQGRTISATVDAILAGSIAPDGTEMWKGQQADDTDRVIEYFDKKFAELKTLIEDTTVYRISSSSSYTPGELRGIEWPQIQDLYSDFPDDREWEPGVRKMWGEADSLDLCSYFTDGKYLYLENYGNKTKIMKMTPKLEEYLK